MAVGEGGPELVKQLLGKTYDVSAPEVVLVWLENTPQPGVGPQDVALAIIGAVFKNGFVKNRVMEFAGPGIDALSVEYRCAPSDQSHSHGEGFGKLCLFCCDQYGC